MADRDVDVLLVSVGADLPFLSGYEAMPLERLTMFVLPADGRAHLVVPALEVDRVVARPDVFEIVGYDDTDDPVALVADLASAPGAPRRVALGDQTWSRFVLALQRHLPTTRFVDASTVTGPVRAVKDAAEVTALASAARVVDRIAAAMRDRPFSGRTELDIHRELVERMLDGGHQRANFAIVAAGPHGASPHHEPTDRVVEPGDLVLCDFGGTMDGYCSDLTRMFHVGEPSRAVRDAYRVLVEAQERAVRAATVGTPAAAVDAAARDVLAEAGYGPAFVHRVGHGIGTEAHEDPYLVATNPEPLVAGNAFSIEPGIYLRGRFGMRLEDIVVATGEGPRRLNEADRSLAVVA